MRAGAIADALRLQTKVEVRIIPEWGREWVALPIRRDEPWRTMERLGEAFNGSWYPVGEKWILADSGSAALITSLSEAEYYELTSTEFRKLFQGITVAQWRLLANGATLPVRRMTRAQQTTVLRIIEPQRYGYGRTMRRPTDAAVTGDGVSLAVTGSGTGANLGILLPFVSRFGKPEKPSLGVSIRFTGDQGQLLWGVPPPTHGEVMLRQCALVSGGIGLTTLNTQSRPHAQPSTSEHRDERGFSRSLVSTPPYWLDSRLGIEVRWSPQAPKSRDHVLYGLADPRDPDY